MHACCVDNLGDTVSSNSKYSKHHLFSINNSRICQAGLFFFFFICSGFCHTLKWNSHGFTCVPHPDPPSHLPLHPLPLGLPSAPGLSACLMHPIWAGDLFRSFVLQIQENSPVIMFDIQFQVVSPSGLPTYVRCKHICSFLKVLSWITLELNIGIHIYLLQISFKSQRQHSVNPFSFFSCC